MDDALTHLFHRNPLQLVRADARPLEARQRSPSELLGTLGGDIDEQEATGDGNSRLSRLGAGCCFMRIRVLRHCQFDRLP